MERVPILSLGNALLVSIELDLQIPPPTGEPAEAGRPVPLEHVANREAEVVRHNLHHPDDLKSADHDLVPAAIFTCPRIAFVGANEQSLRDDGVDYVVGTAEYSGAAYGWAMEDDTGFRKVLAEAPGADGSPGVLLGARILGAQASTLIAPLVLASCR